MAKLNKIINAFDFNELTMLVEIIEREEKRALQEGYILVEPFEELKNSIQNAKKFSAAMRQEYNF